MSKRTFQIYSICVPGFPYFSTGDASAIAAAAFVILASPLTLISTMGGIITPDVLESTVGMEVCDDGICRFLEATAVTIPPPTTAPTAKQAA